MPWWWPFSLDESSRSFNLANQHWKAARDAAAKGDDSECRRLCLETARAAQHALLADPKSGDAYLLLAEALTQLSVQATRPENGVAILERAFAVWHSWRAAEPLWTKNRRHAEGLRLRLAKAEQALDRLDSNDPERFGLDAYAVHGHTVLGVDAIKSIATLSSS